MNRTPDTFRNAQRADVDVRAPVAYPSVMLLARPHISAHMGIVQERLEVLKSR